MTFPAINLYQPLSTFINLGLLAPPLAFIGGVLVQSASLLREMPSRWQVVVFFGMLAVQVASFLAIAIFLSDISGRFIALWMLMTPLITRLFNLTGTRAHQALKAKPLLKNS